MNTATSNGLHRFSASEPCPVCGGSEHDARGQGHRCHGYLSGNRKFIFCARDEHAGACKQDQGSGCYRHVARGPCPCSKVHAPADPKPARGKMGEVDQIYKYHGLDGKVLFEVVRFRNPKDFRQRRPGRDARGKELWGLGNVQPVLYKLPLLATADPNTPVWIVEGEKDADRLGALGLLATTSPMGAGKWRPQYAETVRDRHVIVIADNDDAGRDHAEDIARSLHGVAASVRILELPGVPEKGDASDFLAAGGTVDQLAELARKAPAWTPPPVATPIQVNEATDDPHRLARIYIDEFCRNNNTLTIRFYNDEYMKWDGSAYRRQPPKEVNAHLNRTCKEEFDRANKAEIKEWIARGKVDRKGEDCPPPQAKKVTTRLIGDTTAALASLTLLAGSVEAPAWLIDNPPFADPVEAIPCRNALVHIPSLVAGLPAILDPSPTFFNTYALDFDFDQNAAVPSLWLDFLAKLWDKDQESIGTLQEWFGYCLTPDTSQQKILSMFGPRRSGRGTIARVLRALIGPENVAGPTLGSLASNFGLATLIGKPLAIISDARMSRRTDQAVVTERLLSISGEDCLDIDRKHMEAWTGRLPTRLVLISNELPQLDDASGALPGRMILLQLTRSFYGHEDPTLSDRLMAELPGILLWAIEGWRRLRDRGYFIQPASSRKVLRQLEDLASPVGAFVRERCRIGHDLRVNTKDLYEAWKEWCQSIGRKEGNEQTFGRDIHTKYPEIVTRKTRIKVGSTEVQTRIYRGIALRKKP